MRCHATADDYNDHAISQSPQHSGEQTDYALVVEYMLEGQGASLADVNAHLVKHLVGINGEYLRPRERVLAALAK